MKSFQTAEALGGLVFASVAVARGLTVVTSNVREFERVPGLPHVDWMQS